jgi:hypothetical protein
MPIRGKTKKATFNLHIDVLDGLDEAMISGMAQSKNTLVEKAILKELQELRRQARQKAWIEAAQDPLLLKDIEETGIAFDSADAETARRIK